MKLRIKGNSLRLRLSQQEVARVSQGERVTEAIAFGPESRSVLLYELCPSDKVATVQAQYYENKVRVLVPENLAHRWTTTELVGFKETQRLDAEHELKILVEKDFQCLKPREDEDESDHYPNPQAEQSSHV